MIKLNIFDSIDRISEYTFELLTGAENAALSFGSTYEVIFRKWKILYQQNIADDAGFKMPAFFPADERLVGFEDPGSNWGSAWKTFLSDCGTESDRRRWASDIKSYRSFLTEYFGDDTPGLPVFDLIYLGIGPDGHTASLFPGDCPDMNEPEWSEPVLKTIAPFTPPNRLSLGPELIASAKKLIIVVTGEAKADIFSRLLNEINNKDDKDVLPPVKILRRREALGLDTGILSDPPAAQKLGKQIITEYSNDF